MLSSADVGALPRIDFIVIDKRVVFLSRAYSGTGASVEHFLRIEAECVAEFMKHYYDECWKEAEDLQLKEGVVFRAKKGTPFSASS